MRLLQRCLIFLTFIGVLLMTQVGWNFFPRFVKNNADFALTANELRTTVRYLSDAIGIRNLAYPDALEKSARYIEQSFMNSGLPVESWAYAVKGRIFRNIVARFKNNDSDEYFVVGAHYDSCYNPGADDNASGVAGMLWLANALKKIPLKANILFVAFTNEEPPFFRTSAMGSRVFVKAAKENHARIRGAIILEMIGFYNDSWFSQKYLPLTGPFFPNRANFVAIVGSNRSRALVDLVKDDINKEGHILAQALVAPENVPGLNFSDHASFWRDGIPAIMITDTAYLRNPHYHQSTDTVETLDYTAMAAVLDGVKHAVVHLAADQ